MTMEIKIRRLDHSRLICIDFLVNMVSKKNYVKNSKNIQPPPDVVLCDRSACVYEEMSIINISLKKLSPNPESSTA